ncbi:hypothetical protein [Bremerella sp. P1]|uniref:hypothetical protein n=1 Tax=Bremerella sp. P1 TaxID=3026424 RepID=UPI0023684708|nr:hypothetical protein [Bremerella sp. P1]WDI40221.1 hypothetical protein PSR63_17210 [Bremerella sp. P1]
MTPEEIQRRWDEIDKELEGIAKGRVVDGDPATREGELLEELDRLEYEAGLTEFPGLAEHH